jgi:hypothetical protein
MLHQKSEGVAVAAPDREFLPLRTLAQVLTAFLAADVILTVVTLIAQLVNLGKAPWQVDAELEPLVGLFHTAVVTTAVLFVIWFRRARINAERGCWQSRARPWTLWGWIVPFGNLWIPFQIMRDIWRAGAAPENRTNSTRLVALWWASYLLVKPVSLAFPDGRSHRAWYGLLLVPDNWLSLTLFAIAGILLIAIIGTVSSGPVGSPNAPEPAAKPRHATMSVIARITHRWRSPNREMASAATRPVYRHRRARHLRPGGRPGRGLDGHQPR